MRPADRRSGPGFGPADGDARRPPGRAWRLAARARLNPDRARPLLALLTVTALAAPAMAAVLDTRDALAGSRLEGVGLEPGGRLRATLAAGRASGTLETPVIVRSAFDRAVVSWNALTPAGTWVEVSVRARVKEGSGGRWTRYYRVATWSSDPALERRSFPGERDADGALDTDTLGLSRPGDALQVRVALRSGRPGATPTLTLLAAASFDSRTAYTVRPAVSDRRAWGVDLPVPVRSQMIYPGGGAVWCSPTTVTMLLAFWGGRLGRPLAQAVPDARDAVWDTVYDGGGNWPFNTAYVAARGAAAGLRARVDRLSSLAEAEAYVRRGVPLVLSIGWQPGTLRGAKLPSSSGHILLLRGFTKTGDPITNDPAGRIETLEDVRTVYDRAELERAWIGHSGGVVYVVEPG